MALVRGALHGGLDMESRLKILIRREAATNQYVAIVDEKLEWTDIALATRFDPAKAGEIVALLDDVLGLRTIIDI